MLSNSISSPILVRGVLKRLGSQSSTSVVAASATLLGSSLTRPQATASVVLRCSYITRAHPEPTPVVDIPKALEVTLDEASRRRRLRQRKWKRNEKRRLEKGEPASTTDCSHPDETIELALNLNLDPRKPGQSLRGSISLPNGTGKKLNCLVFTKDEEAQKKALEMGALHAGGETLVQAILQRGSGTTANEDAEEEEEDESNVVVSVDSLDRVLATQDMVPILSKTVARLLGPRGLMPNTKTGTVLSTNEALLESLETQIAGKEVVYRTERAGVVHVPVGKHSFGVSKLLENVGEIMKEIYKAKPEQYGKGKKKSAVSKNAKYLLSAYISATQGKSIKLDLRTIDPASSFFLSAVEAPGAAAAAARAAKMDDKKEQQAPVEETTPSTAEQAKL